MVSIGDSCVVVVVVGVDLGSIRGGVGEVGIADVALVLRGSWLNGVRGVGSSSTPWSPSSSPPGFLRSFHGTGSSGWSSAP